MAPSLSPLSGGNCTVELLVQFNRFVDIAFPVCFTSLKIFFVHGTVK